MASHPMVTRRSLTIAVLPDTVKELDELRGEIPRSRIVQHALNEYLQRRKAEGAATLIK